jgi:hypothetical protein
MRNLCAMKALFKLAAVGALTAIAINLYRRYQRFNAAPSSPDDQVADTNLVVTGDPAQRQSVPQPQDWRSAQNVLE